MAEYKTDFTRKLFENPYINKHLLRTDDIKKNMNQSKSRLPNIIIRPFHPVCLCDNSYTMSLSDKIYTDSERNRRITSIPIIGIIANPGDVFYCETYETLETSEYHPILMQTTASKLHGLTIQETLKTTSDLFSGSIRFTITADRLTSFSPGLPVIQVYFARKIR